MSNHRHVLLVATILASAAAPCQAGSDDTFYVIDNQNNGFFRSSTGHIGGDVLVAQLAATFWADMSPADEDLHLFATDAVTGAVSKIRETDGAIVDSFASDRTARSLAYDRTRAVMYGLPQAGAPDLYTIDTTDGSTQTIGPTNIDEGALGITAMVYDPVADGLFAATLDGNLYRIDTSDGAATLVGNFGLSNPFGLAYNPNDQRLYATDAVTDLVYLVDRTDASLDVVGGPFQNATFVTCFASSNVSPCAEDLDGSGLVDFGDILAILAAWGNAGGPEDLDDSGFVDFGDLLIVLTAWGPCA